MFVKVTGHVAYLVECQCQHHLAAGTNRMCCTGSFSSSWDGTLKYGHWPCHASSNNKVQKPTELHAPTLVNVTCTIIFDIRKWVRRSATTKCNEHKFNTNWHFAAFPHVAVSIYIRAHFFHFHFCFNFNLFICFLSAFFELFNYSQTNKSKN